MPTYEWKCKNCETTQEVVRKIDESEVPPEGECPHCMKKAGWRKLLNASITRWRFHD